MQSLEVARSVEHGAPPVKVLGWCEAAKSYLAQWKLLEMRAGVLYRRWVNGDGRLRWLQLIPLVGLRHELMVHAEAAGNLGPSKTMKQVTR